MPSDPAPLLHTCRSFETIPHPAATERQWHFATYTAHTWDCDRTRVINRVSYSAIRAAARAREMGAEQSADCVWVCDPTMTHTEKGAINVAGFASHAHSDVHEEPRRRLLSLD